MRINVTWLALAAAGALALGVAACGSSDNSSSEPRAARSSAAAARRGTINGAGSTFAAPIYQQWGTDLKGKGITVNYQAVGSGAGIAAARRRHRRLRRLATRR